MGMITLKPFPVLWDNLTVVWEVWYDSNWILAKKQSLPLRGAFRLLRNAKKGGCWRSTIPRNGHTWSEWEPRSYPKHSEERAKISNLYRSIFLNKKARSDYVEGALNGFPRRVQLYGLSGSKNGYNGLV